MLITSFAEKEQIFIIKLMLHSFLMVERLTTDDKIFADTVIKTGNATKAVIKAYGITDENYAGVKGHRMLRQAKIASYLAAKGFDSNNAKRVVGEIMNDSIVEPKDRLKAAELTFKVHGDFAAEKSINVNVNTADLQKAIAEDLVRFRKV